MPAASTMVHMRDTLLLQSFYFFFVFLIEPNRAFSHNNSIKLLKLLKKLTEVMHV